MSCSMQTRLQVVYGALWRSLQCFRRLQAALCLSCSIIQFHCCKGQRQLVPLHHSGLEDDLCASFPPHLCLERLPREYVLRKACLQAYS